jgi:hypothetical protein
VNIDEINTVRVGRYNAICVYNGQPRFSHLLNSYGDHAVDQVKKLNVNMLHVMLTFNVKKSFLCLDWRQKCNGIVMKEIQPNLISAFNGMYKLQRSTMSYSKNIQDRSLKLY